MLVIDSREARNHPDFEVSLSSLLPDEVGVDLLDSGDFASLNTPLTLGVERKSFKNITSSLGTGELDEQLSRLVDTYNLPVLLIEGLPNPTIDGKLNIVGDGSINYSWLMNNVFGWYARGVLPLFVKSMASTPQAVAALYVVASKSEHRTTFSPRRLLPNLRKLPFPYQVLSLFPGLGEVRLKKVEEVLGKMSLSKMAELSAERWQEIVGDKVGKEVHKRWRR